MTVTGVYKRMPVIKVRFITGDNTFTLQTDTAEQKNDASILKGGDLVEQIISFNTENDMANDTPIFSLVLAGLERWDRILQPNDIVTIKINPGDGNTVINDVIMVGMISEVKKIGSYNDSSIVYQISGQSMAKALMQLNLGTLQEIASITQGFGWMTSMGATSTEENSSEGKGTVLQPKATKQFSVGATKITSGRFKDIDGNTISGDTASIAIVSKDTGIKNNTWINVQGYGDVKARVINNISLLSNNLFDIFGEKTKDIYVSLSSSKAISSYNKKFNNTTSTVKIYDTKNSPTWHYNQSLKKDSKITADNTGLLFTGKTAAEVVETIIRWFMNLSGDDMQLTSSLKNTDITYNFNGDRKNFGDWVELNLNSRSEDEMLLDALPLMSFTGSLRQMISQAQATPYNEFYTEFTSDEKAMFNMRPTPFEPDDWKPLENNAFRLDAYNVIEETLARNDTEVYSVFSSSIPTSVTLNSVSDLMMYPVYFPGLAQKYGYSMLEQQNNYIFRMKKVSTTSGGSDSSSLDMASGDMKTNAKNIASALKKAGASGVGIAALLGTMQGESSLNPSAVQNGSFNKTKAMDANIGGYAIGLAQWDSGRRVNLLNYATKQKKAWDNLGLQVSFLLKGDGADSNTIKGYLASNDSIENLVTKMVTNWERPGDASSEIAKRIPFAKAWYSSLGLSSVTGSGSINTNKIGMGNTLDDAIGKKVTSTSLSDLVPKSSNPYPSIGSVLADQQKAAKTKATKKAKAKAKIDADNVNLAKKYSVYLANWYGNNNSFISGEIRVVGHPDYRVGTVLYRYDPYASESLAKEYIFYIESVSHEFSYTGGYTTTLGVTRGLPRSVDRFATWNDSSKDLTAEKPGNGDLQFFNGGLFGELSVASLADKGFKDASSSNDSSSSSDDSSSSSKGLRGDTYPSKWRDAIADSTVDDWGYFNRECVSFVAYCLSEDGRTSFSNLGNAIEWKDNSGLAPKKTPKVGDVAWFNTTDAPGAYGHVAYVARVSGDKVTIEEYNYNYNHAYHVRTINKNQATGYLRFPKK